MSLHKLTAGDGYTYLTRQVAAFDTTERGHAGLGDYYSQRGESPGVWAGGGLAGLSGMSPGQQVGEEQMRALFGEGRHPDAARLEQRALAKGLSAEEARAAGALGQPFPDFAPDPRGFRARCAERYAAVNAADGLPPGTPILAEERARIRSELARAMFGEAYGRPPTDARELSGFIARASRPATTAVAGYDLTFSPVKSVSALWALAPRELATRIEEAHAAAVADVLGWLEQHACFTRLGHAGVRQVETTGLVAAVFTHRESRAGDPDLHTHVAVSNKVQTRDGRWRALDGRVLHKAVVAASKRYNTRLEAHLVDGAGLRFAPRPGDEPGRRPVREIVGMDPRLLARWSSRRQAIDVRRGELAADFQRDHGRPACRDGHGTEPWDFGPLGGPSTTGRTTSCPDFRARSSRADRAPAPWARSCISGGTGIEWPRPGSGAVPLAGRLRVVRRLHDEWRGFFSRSRPGPRSAPPGRRSTGRAASVAALYEPKRARRADVRAVRRVAWMRRTVVVPRPAARRSRRTFPTRPGPRSPSRRCPSAGTRSISMYRR
ncbi:MobF family relaxase [Geodermatophilus chilensis]|uniref:MobF family relaxase n=1 Tax=Geodermatophilus chilensis TaxID=2035835 RepID=UPI001E52CA4E|nr:MobF family relaxase [Geodermatophilus chilensis]